MPTKDLEARFAYNPHALALARSIDAAMQDGREKSLALTKLEESLHWTVAGIARTKQEISEAFAQCATEWTGSRDVWFVVRGQQASVHVTGLTNLRSAVERVLSMVAEPHLDSMSVDHYEVRDGNGDLLNLADHMGAIDTDFRLYVNPRPGFGG